jgi:hypothetical protein
VVTLVKPLRHQSSLRLKLPQPKLHQLKRHQLKRHQLKWHQLKWHQPTTRLRAPKSQSSQQGMRSVGRV